eukprot:TRINITY_DN9324_c0_g1_i1.p1 TRINITY_DN9324_c0_g1~~TRINITY_DN9324_c0_g1_i1.p1  ORF type:complete len:254 (+),score=40.58 TRINITY_DN9324_c0_g1_i1:38-799(+)
MYFQLRKFGIVRPHRLQRNFSNKQKAKLFTPQEVSLSFEEGVRLFVGFSLSSHPVFSKKSQELITHLQSFLYSYEKVKWTEPRNLHCTLKFFEQFPISKLHDLELICEEAASLVSPFNISFKAIDVFPSWKKPRVLYLCVDEGKEQVKKLAKTIHTKSELQNNFALLNAKNHKGQKRVSVRFEHTPHVTLARWSEMYVPSFANDVIKDFSNMLPHDFPDVEVTELTIFRSELFPTGPVYTSLKSFPLRVNQPV